MNEMRYLFVSWENSCVYGVTHRVITANAILSGLGSYLYLRGATLATMADDYEKIKVPGFFNSGLYQLPAGTAKLVRLPPTATGSDFTRIQDLIKLRLRLFTILEAYTTSALSRTTRYKWEEFHSMACHELRNCDPANNIYTPVFEEYARILEVPEEIAYKELKLTTESDTITRFRITAMAEKWKQKINQIERQDQIKGLLDQMRQEFWTNTRI